MTKHFRYFDWFWVAYLVALGWLWYPLWANSNIPAFRDGFHFYYPQFYWLDRCYQSGEFFPKWNPDEGLGCSVWGQPTWQIFYPLRLLWLLPLWNLPQIYAIWIVVHQIVATLGMKRLAAEYQLSNKAGWLAGISYSMGCPVLFQYTNVVYLCSAAWVGWALIPISRILFLEPGIGSHRKSLTGSGLRESSLLGRGAKHGGPFVLACSMMLLCGDPHTAVNTAIIGCGCLIVAAFRYVRTGCLAARQSQPGPQQEAPPDSMLSSASESTGIGELRRVGQRWAWLLQYVCTVFNIGRKPLGIRLQPAVARTQAGSLCHVEEQTHVLCWMLRTLVVLAIFVLVAVQAVAGWNWFGHSSRSKQPVSVTDSYSPAVAEILCDDSDRPAPKVFDFSISPWSLPSFLWPTIGGYYQPEHSRWVDALESEGRMWTPSLYIGLVPLLLAFKRWRFPITSHPTCHYWRVEQFLFWTSCIALLAAMGNYSLVWMVRQLLTVAGLTEWSNFLPADSSGSLYGLLTQIVPGYDSFRYPAKWIVWTAAGLSFSAAVQLDQWTPGRNSISTLRKPSVAVGLISVAIISCCSVVSLLNPEVQPVLAQWLEKSHDRLLGKAQTLQVIQEIGFALHWPIVILSLIGIGIVGLPKRHQVSLVLIVCLVDLFVCARHWIATTPEPPRERLTVVGRSNQGYWANLRHANTSDFHRADFHRADFRRAVGSINLTEHIELQRTFKIGKLGLLDEAATFHASGPLRPWAVVKIERWLSLHDTLQADQPELDEVLSHLGISRRLIRSLHGGFEWKAIENVRPLCEIIVMDSFNTRIDDVGLPEGVVSINWQWTSNSILQIRTSVERECKLLIRQFNDGGWIVECSTVAELEPEVGEMFISLSLTPGTHVLELSRKTLL